MLCWGERIRGTHSAPVLLQVILWLARSLRSNTLLPHRFSTIPLRSRSEGSLGFPPNQCWDDTFHCLRRFLILNIRPIHCKAIMEPATGWECKGWFKAETRNSYSPLHIERIRTGAEQLQFIDLQGFKNKSKTESRKSSLFSKLSPLSKVGCSTLWLTD